MTSSTLYPKALQRPKGTRKVWKRVYAFWAYDILDPESRDDRKYCFLSREEAVKAQQEIGDGTTIREEWSVEYV